MAKETGMTRGGGRARGMDQLEWLTKVVHNKAFTEASGNPSRSGSVSRHGSQGTSGDRSEWMTLKDEVVLVNKLYPRPRIHFEKVRVMQSSGELTFRLTCISGN